MRNNVLLEKSLMHAGRSGLQGARWFAQCAMYTTYAYASWCLLSDTRRLHSARWKPRLLPCPERPTVSTQVDCRTIRQAVLTALREVQLHLPLPLSFPSPQAAAGTRLPP